MQLTDCLVASRQVPLYGVGFQLIVKRLLHEGDLLRCFRNSGLGHVRKYAPFVLILSALHLILRAKSQHI